mgnify:CR=1 FL=1
MMKLIMENWRHFKENVARMPKLSAPDDEVSRDPNFPDMVKGRKSQRIDADPEDILAALDALQKNRDMFKKSDRTLNIPKIDKDAIMQLGLFVNDVEDSIESGGMSPEAKREIEKKILDIKKIIKSRDDLEKADTIQSPAPDTGSRTGSAWYDALDLKEAMNHARRILEIIQDGKN